jgi:hypothetical protein
MSDQEAELPEQMTDFEDEAQEPFDLETYPLDKDLSWGIDWGGDGSDPLRPVRAHVLAALVPTDQPYAAPLDALLTLGDLREAGTVERRKALPIGQKHVAELVRMMRDRRLNTLDSDQAEVWAPMHAAAILATLDLRDVFADVIPIFDIEDDWRGDELAEAIGRVGAAAFPALQGSLRDRSRWEYARVSAASALGAMATSHPELREQVIAEFSQLVADRAETASFTSWIISELAHLHAVEALPVIRQAFESGHVDEFISGDWRAVLNEFGLTPEPGDPLVKKSEQRAKQQQVELRRGSTGGSAINSRKKTDATRKAKNKRKTAKAARKANRRKK